MELRRFFDRAIRASFSDLAFRDDPVVPYLADLLTRFARTENLFPRGATVPRLETVVDMVIGDPRILAGGGLVVPTRARSVPPTPHR